MANVITLWAKDWGIEEMEFICQCDSVSEARRLKRHYETNYPDDRYGRPCRYVIQDEPPPEPGHSQECLAAAGVELWGGC